MCSAFLNKILSFLKNKLNKKKIQKYEKNNKNNYYIPCVLGSNQQTNNLFQIWLFKMKYLIPCLYKKYGF